MRIEAPTLSEAYAKAAEALGCSMYEIDFEVLQHPSAGLFGLFKKNAIVEATIEQRYQKRAKNEKKEPKKETRKEKGGQNRGENRAENLRENRNDAARENRAENRAENRDARSDTRAQNREKFDKTARKNDSAQNVKGRNFDDRQPSNLDKNRASNSGANLDENSKPNLGENRSNLNRNFDKPNAANLDANSTVNSGEISKPNLDEISKPNLSENASNLGANSSANLEPNAPLTSNDAPNLQAKNAESFQNQSEQNFDRNLAQNSEPKNFSHSGQNFTADTQKSEPNSTANFATDYEPNFVQNGDQNFNRNFTQNRNFSNESFAPKPRQKRMPRPFTPITDELLSEITAKTKALFSASCFSISEISVRKHSDKVLYIFIDGEDAALLIGKDGRRYKAILYMLNNWINYRYGLNVRLEISKFLQNQEAMIAHYLIGVSQKIDENGHATTKTLDGVLAEIALNQLRAMYPNKYVAIKTGKDGKYVVINDFKSE